VPRIFIGFDLPDAIDDHLDLVSGGIPGARWEGRERLHATLRFVGDVEGARLRDLYAALDDVEAPPMTLEIAGVGVFPPRGEAKVIWVGFADDRAVVDLQRRIERAVVRAGFEPESRKYTAHVTLARLKGASRDRVAAFIAHHSLLHTASFEVRAFLAYSSVLGPGGAKYRIERSFPLVG
jgi:2'-5' RNA ligase